MRAILIATLLLSGTAAAQSSPAEPQPPVAPNTVVNFVHPEKFIDASDVAFGIRPSERMLDKLRQIFVTLGGKYLAPDQQLKIDVTDVDLAGRFQPALSPGDQVRVLRESDWPRISVHYTLEKDGVVEKQADARIADMNYLSRQLPGRSSRSLSYEQRMLDNWFAQTFKQAPQMTRSQ
ncbi:MAG TPA: DUF3016 domain-containing protein [Solimonas sp.]